MAADGEKFSSGDRQLEAGLEDVWTAPHQINGRMMSCSKPRYECGSKLCK